MTGTCAVLHYTLPKGATPLVVNRPNSSQCDPSGIQLHYLESQYSKYIDPTTEPTTLFTLFPGSHCTTQRMLPKWSPSPQYNPLPENGELACSLHHQDHSLRWIIGWALPHFCLILGCYFRGVGKLPSQSAPNTTRLCCTRSFGLQKGNTELSMWVNVRWW